MRGAIAPFFVNPMQFGPGPVPTFLYYFTSMAVLSILITVRALDISTTTGIPQAIGTLGGLLAGGLGVYFNRTISYTLSIQSQKKFLNQLLPILTQMGYELVLEEEFASEEELVAKEDISEEDTVQIYERSAGMSRWISGRVFVQLEEKTATIAGRAVTMRKLKQAIGCSGRCRLSVNMKTCSIPAYLHEPTLL